MTITGTTTGAVTKRNHRSRPQQDQISSVTGIMMQKDSKAGDKRNSSLRHPYRYYLVILGLVISGIYSSVHSVESLCGKEGSCPKKENSITESTNTNDPNNIQKGDTKPLSNLNVSTPSQYRVCVIAEGTKQLKQFLRKHKTALEDPKVLGAVELLEPNRKNGKIGTYSKHYSQPFRWDFVGYNAKIAPTCHLLLLAPLSSKDVVARWHNKHEHILTIRKAADSKLPLVVDERIFNKYTTDDFKSTMVETYNGGATTWEQALQQMIYQLDSEQCHVVIDNFRYDQHMEVLESIMSKVPLHALPSFCNTLGITVDFHISPHSRSREWAIYANDVMRKQTYAGGTRHLGKVYSQAHTTNRPYAINVTATCKCSPPFVAALKNDLSLVCMFHDTCPEVADHPRAFWFHPDEPHSFFPNIMPQFERRSNKRISPYHLCVIGSVRRRNYRMLERFLASSTRRDFTVVIMGKGVIPSFFKDYHVQTNQSTPASFLDYQLQVATGCDVILALVDRNKNGDYFTKSKMTGSVVQASAYKHPFVVHKDLLTVYGEYLKDQVVETHTDDPQTFVDALTRLLARLDAEQEHRS